MRMMRQVFLSLLTGFVLMATAQPVADEVEWYLDEVVSDVFVKQNDFEYYYVPGNAEIAQQREKGEVTYFLNSPAGLNSKKVRDLIDRLMARYDDIKAQGEWHMTSTTYWKEFRYDKNRFRFSVKRKALDDGTYYVGLTENANYYKSLGKKSTKTKAQERKKSTSTAADRRSTRRDRKPVVDPEEAEASTVESDDVVTPFVSEKQRRQEAREQQEAQRLEERARQRRAQEKRREEARAQKEAEKLKKAEEKKQKEEEKRLKKEEERRLRQQAREEREQERREKAAARKQAAAPKPVESRYHYQDIALWLSEKYDFTQIASGESSCTMYSSAVKDVEMAKLAIKNALKGSNARMAVPWRVNGETQAVETGYTVDGHVLVFAIGKGEGGEPTITVTEVSGEQFELFKQQH